MAHVHTSHRGRQYDPHPVPHKARLAGHLAQWFQANANAQYSPATNGREIAEEMTRNLRPSARRTLLETEPT